jgi:hypothetical protein
MRTSRCSDSARDDAPTLKVRSPDGARDRQPAFRKTVNSKSGSFETGIAQPESEREPGFNVFVIEPAITHVEALAVRGFVIDPLR